MSSWVSDKVVEQCVSPKTLSDSHMPLKTLSPWLKWFDYLFYYVHNGRNLDTFQIEDDRDDREQTANDGSDPLGDTFPTAQPNIIVPAQRMDSRPKAVCQMEPQGHVPNDVQDSPQSGQWAFMKIVVDESRAISRAD